ncbi:MAG TPA: hypothetical protein VMU51_32155 [Mycobacteriales bacterium]|nr:hypothetical protein [Mycobacteriales bacterium]
MPALAAILVATTAVQLASLAISWLAGYFGERERARTLVALLRLAGPGAVLIDRRPSGVALSLHTAARSDELWRPPGVAEDSPGEYGRDSHPGPRPAGGLNGE